METLFLHFFQGIWGPLWDPLWSVVKPVWPLIWVLLQIVGILIPLLLSVAYLTYFERKVIGYMHVRIGPNRVGPLGLLQPIADALKLLFKEIITPSRADKSLYFFGPVLAMAPALAVWVVIPYADGWVMATSMPACCSCWRSVRSASMATSSPAGPRTPSIPSSAACVRRPRWCPTKCPWAWPWSAS